MAIVTLAVARDGLGELPGSGFLVPPVEGRGIKASTFSSNKWAWVAGASEEAFFLRASVGRAGEEADLQRADDDLVRLAVAEVGEALGRPLTPLRRRARAAVGRRAAAVCRRAPLARRLACGPAVARLPGLELAGAAYDGVGIPACIGSGRAAAAGVATHLTTASAAGG